MKNLISIALALFVALVMAVTVVPALPAKATEENNGIAIDDTNFPDSNFRSWVSSERDWDEDGYLSDDERGYYGDELTIDISGEGISNLKGIELFYNVYKLDCSDNNLTGTLDLSSLDVLERLDCSGNKLEGLKVNNNAYLYKLDVRYNQMKEDVLAEFKVDEDSECTRYLYPQGENVDLVEIIADNFPDDTFRSYVNDNYNNNGDNWLNLEEIYNITCIDFEGKSVANLKGIEHFTYLTALYCNDSELSGTLDLSALTKLSTLLCQNNNLNNIIVNENAPLKYVNLRFNDFSEEVLNAFPKEEQFKSDEWDDEYEQPYVYLRPQGNVSVDINGTNFEDVNFRKYITDEIDSNGDGKLSGSEIYAATELSLSDKGISNLKGIEYFTNLYVLYCSDNKLTGVLDLSMLNNLRRISLKNNQLEGLILNSEIEYYTINVKYNRLSKDKIIGHDNDWDWYDWSGDYEYYRYFYPQGEKKDIPLTESYFPDEVLRQELKGYDENRNGILSADELEQITYLYEDEDEGINDFEGIQYLTSLETLRLADMRHGTIPELPDKISELYVYDCGLDSLPELPENLRRLNCEGNLLKTLPPLPAGLESLDCSGNKLTSLPALPAGLESLHCSNNALTKLPALPATVREFYCYDNKLTSLPDLSKLTKLKVLWCYDNALTALPVLPANLEEIECGDNQLTKLPTLPAYLLSLDCSNNKLTALPTLPLTLNSINFYKNQLSGTLDLSNLKHLKHIDISYNKIGNVKLNSEANYSSIYLYNNYLLSTKNITGRNDITWDSDGFWYSSQESKCVITGKHSFGAYEPWMQATTSANGKQVRTCSICWKQESKSIPKIKSIKLSKTSYTFDGKAKKPSVTIKDSNGKTLKKGTDYVVDYYNNKQPGTATVSINFIGNYCDYVSKTFKIKSPVKVKLSKTDFTYNGKKQKPTVKVYNSKGKKLSTKYYTVSYSKSSSKKVGVYTVSIKLKKGYKGTLKYTYNINPKATKISSVKAAKKAFTVKWKKQSSQTTGYQIQYSTSSKMKNPTIVTVSKTSTTSKKIKSLKAKKKYYVQVRTYKIKDGKVCFSKWSSKKSVKTK